MLRSPRTKGVLSLAVGLLGVFAITGLTSSAYGGNFIATGHDMDLHCYNYILPSKAPESLEECHYLKIVVDKVRNGSTATILALDPGKNGTQQVPQALANAGYAAGEVKTVDPTKSEFKTLPFVDASGAPLYSAIITASDESCGGCDMSQAGEEEIEKRKSDFKTYFNAGGGILALSGANNYLTYYNFVPLKVAALKVEKPFTVEPEGKNLKITKAMVECCQTHNSFELPPSPFVVLETDTKGRAETILASEATIGKDAFEGTLTTSLSGEAKSGATITVREKTAVTDSATLQDANAKEATGKVEYKVYSDSECKTLVAEAGALDVTAGTMPPSNPETLAPGTYYWQASYSGDAKNAAAESACGSEVETVKAGHWRCNGPEPPECTVISWGTLALKTVLGGSGEVACHTVGAGTVENPASGAAGVGLTQVFATFDCEQTALCPANTTVAVAAEALPWRSVLEADGSLIRSTATGIKEHIACLAGGNEVGGARFLGSLRPNFKIGTSALHPGFLEYDPGSGAVEQEGSNGGVTAVIEGETKILGYAEQELINVSLSVPRFR